MRCCECGSDMRFTNEPITEEFRGKEYTVNGIERWECDHCGNNLMTGEMATILAKSQARQYAIDEGLFLPEEIKEIRQSLGLTQEQFESVIGVKFPAVSRWENGATLPTKTACKIMQALRDEPLIRNVFYEMAGIELKGKTKEKKPSKQTKRDAVPA